MTPQQFVKFYGTQRAAALALGVTERTVSNYVRDKHIPRIEQWAISYITNGKLKADKS